MESKPCAGSKSSLTRTHTQLIFAGTVQAHAESLFQGISLLFTGAFFKNKKHIIKII
jgi:hypothetical protein